jgi:hypothetical protein
VSCALGLLAPEFDAELVTRLAPVCISPSGKDYSPKEQAVSTLFEGRLSASDSLRVGSTDPAVTTMIKDAAKADSIST